MNYMTYKDNIICTDSIRSVQKSTDGNMASNRPCISLTYITGNPINIRVNNPKELDFLFNEFHKILYPIRWTIEEGK